MSSPHGAGTVALMMALHPTWSPAEIKSAIAMTALTNPVPLDAGSANILKQDGATPADWFDMGGGRLDLGAAAYAGLVLDETYTNFVDANPALGGDPRTLNLPGMQDWDCVNTCVFTRTVASTLDITSTWTASVSVPVSMTLDVSPSSFTLAPHGTQTLVITADISNALPGTWNFALVNLHTDTVLGTDLHLAKDDGGLSAEPGDTVTYTLTYSNTGTGASLGVVITDTVPANSSFNAAASSAGWQEVSAGTYTYDVGLLGSGEDGSVTFAVDVDDPFPEGVDVITNTATIADNDVDSASATDTTPVTILPPPVDEFSIYLPIVQNDSGTVQTPSAQADNKTANAPTDIVISDAHLPVAVFSSEQPEIEVDPTSLTSQQGQGVIVTQTLTISNIGTGDLDWSIFEDDTTPDGGTWSDNFDSYVAGSNLHGQGGWKGWANNPAAGALVSTAQALSSPNSADINGASDLVHEYTNTSGQWTYVAWQYIPSSLTGNPYFIMMNEYDDAGVNLNWSVQLCFNSTTGMLIDDIPGSCSTGTSMPFVTDQWVEIRVLIDLDADQQWLYYDGQLLYNDVWNGHASGAGTGSDAIAAVDLFANNSNAVYYDDVELLSGLIPPSGGDVACDAPTDIPWAAVSPASGSTAGGSSSDVTVAFDSTGLTPDVYTGTLCIQSNASLSPLVEVPLSLEVLNISPPVIDVFPGTLENTQAPDVQVTLPLTISNGGGVDLTWTIFEDQSSAPLGGWSDNFDSYPTGQNLHGVGGWKGWDNSPAATAFTSAAQALSSPNSVDIVGAADLVHPYTGYTSGAWTYTAWQYIPNTFTGLSYFLLLNTYNDGGPYNWSSQVNFNAATDQVVNDGLSGGALPIVYDQWVEIRVEIDLDADTQDFYYNNQLLYSGTWTGEVSGGGAVNIATVDLFANTGTSVFYDDISLAPNIPPVVACDAPEDISWIDVSPTSGTTVGGNSDTVNVTFDSTSLGAGVYTGTLCVTSNDLTNPLVTVPLTLTVSSNVGGSGITTLTFSNNTVPVVIADPAVLTPRE
jgi:uncharacterized repeat protein (TIGR01451 family)